MWLDLRSEKNHFMIDYNNDINVLKRGDDLYSHQYELTVFSKVLRQNKRTQSIQSINTKNVTKKNVRYVVKVFPIQDSLIC